ncbi:hypothetical protein GCM10011519_35070 [Marmoricola endophyticus]|uniref:Uncharacterized protein n=1 Tax=Marmoricola endophyticus TaxID=2040280 RepID=A0A917F9E3_9ACTN|nr:hypothetical protein [Marmoricola endophyticus]GGF58208.1 hypothetical protein GCM10011519_35070 [Marmoricola endophyticus]
MTQESFPGEQSDGMYGEAAMPAEPGADPVDGVEPDIAEAVHHIANRYGAPGLEQLIGAAQGELQDARRALESLGAESEE